MVNIKLAKGVANKYIVQTCWFSGQNLKFHDLVVQLFSCCLSDHAQTINKQHHLLVLWVCKNITTTNKKGV